MEYHEEDTEEHEPVNDWRSLTPYDAGIKRKKVTFVPAGYLQTEALPQSTKLPSKLGPTGAEVSSFYLSLVGLGESATATKKEGGEEDEEIAPKSTPAPPETDTQHPTCSTCNLPITNVETHGMSMAHQLSLPHSRPPHHYPRSSKGLKVLVESGWDPDDTLGLGSEGQGIRFPLKAVPKNDTYGIGVKVKKRREEGKVEPAAKTLGVKAIRKLEKERAGKRKKLLMDMGSGDEVERLLYGKMEEL